MGIIACRIQEDELPPQSRESLLANALHKNLLKLASEGNGFNEPYVAGESIKDVTIDGHVDLLALATATLVDFDHWEKAQQ